MTEDRSSRRRDLWCVVLLILLPTILFSDVLVAGNNFFVRDLYRYHFPMKRTVRDAIASGEFPYWNRAFAGGQPMAANPAYEIFYPPQWLIFVGSYDRGFALHVLFHVYLALLGMYALLRALPLRPGAAFAGAVSFGLGGVLLGTLTNLPAFFVWSWAGVGGWAALRYVRTPRRGTLAVAAIVLAMPLLVAEPIALVQLWALIAAGAWLIDRRSLPRVALVLGVALLLAAVQLLPMIDHMRDSSRARGFSYELMSYYSMRPGRPLELLAPLPDQANLPYLVSIYCGLFAVIFAAAGVVARARGAVAFLAVAAISYSFAVGLPFRLFYDVGFRSIRYPEKFAAAGLIAMIVFAATVADRVAGGDARLRRAVIGCAIGAVLMTNIQPGRFLIGTAVAAGWAVLVWRRWPAVIGLALLLVDLVPSANRTLPRAARQYFTPPPIVRALPAGATLAHRAEWMVDDRNRRWYERFRSTWLPRNALRPFTPAAWGLRTVLEADIDETFLLPTHQLMDAFVSSGGSDRVIALSGADYVVDWRHHDEATRETDDPALLQPLIIRRLHFGGRYRTPARILALQETNNSATIDLDAAKPSPLLMLVTRHKYWRVAIDGRETGVVPANIAFQGVMVPAGRHRVTMRYRNPLIAWGALVSAFTLVAVIAPRPPRRRPRSGS